MELNFWLKIHVPYIQNRILQNASLANFLIFESVDFSKNFGRHSEQSIVADYRYH